MQNNFPKIPLLLSLIFLILASLACFYFYRAINDNNDKSESSRVIWATEASRRAEIEKFNSAIKIIEPKKAELENHFAKSSDVVPFLDMIEGLGPEVAVSTEITAVDIAKDHTGLLVGLKISGNFKNTFRFITLLENSPYELVFNSVSVKKTAGQDPAKVSVENQMWTGVLQMKLLSFIE